MIENKLNNIEIKDQFEEGDYDGSELFTREPSIFDTYSFITNEGFILPENVWLKGRVESMSLVFKEDVYRQEQYHEIRFKFLIKDNDSNCTEEAIYTCRQDIPFNKNRKLQRLISSVLGYIPRGKIDLKQLLIGKEATIKIKTYSQKDGSDIHYITEIK